MSNPPDGRSRLRPTGTGQGHRHRGLTVEERFWSFVGPLDQDEGHRLWMGSLDKYGYPRISISGRWVAAHRYALGLKLKRPLEPGIVARHTCVDHRDCVAFEHLVEGTLKQNSADKTDAERYPDPYRMILQLRKDLAEANSEIERLRDL